MPPGAGATTVAQIVAAVIPSATPPGRRGGSPGTTRSGPLPLTKVSESPSAPPGTTYALCRVDSSGRVTDRTITTALHWHPGDRLTITTTADAILVHRDPEGTALLPAKPCIAIPAALRRHHHIHTSDQLLLAATPDADVLAIYPLTTVHRALTDHHIGGDPR
jgi:hypothetical protein